MTTLVVIACHFKSAHELCATTVARLQKALQVNWELSPAQTMFMVGGNVPYRKGGPTLQHLMKEWLAEHGAIAKHRIMLNEGTGTFSEARESTRMLAAPAGSKKAIVISSNWWLWSGKTIWRRFARKHGLPVEFVAVRHSGGWRTHLIYMAYAAIVHASFALGFSDLVEKHLNKMQEKRLEGFTWDGCR